MYSITWLDPRTDDADEPVWAVWTTKCGSYRITWEAERDTYTPHTRASKIVNATCISTTDTPIGKGFDTLEEAQDFINQYHCGHNNLTLVEG